MLWNLATAGLPRTAVQTPRDSTGYFVIRDVAGTGFDGVVCVESSHSGTLQDEDQASTRLGRDPARVTVVLHEVVLGLDAGTSYLLFHGDNDGGATAISLYGGRPPKVNSR